MDKKISKKHLCEAIIKKLKSCDINWEFYYVSTNDFTFEDYRDTFKVKVSRDDFAYNYRGSNLPLQKYNIESLKKIYFYLNFTRFKPQEIIEW